MDMRSERPAYREFPPSPPVSEIVARLWCLVATSDLEPRYVHKVLPDGCVDLVVVGRGRGFFTVRGPRDRPLDLVLEPGDRFWGARLWPDVGGRLLGVDAKSLIGIQAPAASFFGGDAEPFAHRVTAGTRNWRELFEEWLVPRLAGLPALDTKVRMTLVAQHVSRDGLSTGDLAVLVGLSPRQLQRRFSRATGLTLKTYARIRRLRRVVGHLITGEPVSWAGVAASLGFADQSHLIAEFRRLAGASPVEVARYIASLDLSDVVP